MPSVEEYLNVRLEMPRIERIIENSKSMFPSGKPLPEGFARVAWKDLGGESPRYCRTSAEFGSAMCIDHLEGATGFYLLAYVVLPNVTFAGWIPSADVTHPRRIDPLHLHSVWEFFPKTWRGVLTGPSRDTNGTWMGHLAKEAV